MKSQTLHVTINCPPEEVYAFASDLRNLPKWAGAFCQSIFEENGTWTAETPQGPVTIRMAPKNSHGILDHYVSPKPGVEIHVPMRVVPNEKGSEVLFTLFRQPAMSDSQYIQDVKWVERDLKGLKAALEENA